jgi:hypothetical protein
MTGALAALALDPRMFRVRSVRTFVVSALAAGALVGCSGSDGARDPFGRDNVPTNGAPATGESAPGPVRIKNLSFTTPRKKTTGEELAITFVVEKDYSVTSINRLEDVSITFGGERRTYAAEYCQQDIVRNLGGVVTLTVSDNGSTSSVVPDTNHSCSTQNRSFAEDATLQPWSEAVTVELSGLLGDATPWRATATSATQR